MMATSTNTKKGTSGVSAKRSDASKYERTPPSNKMKVTWLITYCLIFPRIGGVLSFLRSGVRGCKTPIQPNGFLNWNQVSFYWPMVEVIVVVVLPGV